MSHYSRYKCKTSHSLTAVLGVDYHQSEGGKGTYLVNTSICLCSYMLLPHTNWHLLSLEILSVAGSDYVAGPLQATFSTSSMEGATSCVNISILQDIVLEGDHSFGVEVTSATPSVVMVGVPSEGTVLILDDESMCTNSYIISGNWETFYCRS